MLSLSILDVETPAVKVAQKQSIVKPGCTHQLITVDVDGETFVLDEHTTDLTKVPTTEDVRAMVVTWLRLRRQRGKVEVGVRIA